MKLQPDASRDSTAALILALVLVGLCPVGVRGAEFATGQGVALANGVAAVHFHPDRGLKVLLPHGPAVGLMEIQTTFTDGVTGRTSALYVGSHALQTPFTVERTETFGALGVLIILLGFLGLLKWTLYTTRGKPGIAPKGGPAMGLGNSETGEGPPSGS